VKLHDLRHFHACGLIAAGCDFVAVQRAPGHARATTPRNTYAPLGPAAEHRTRTAPGSIMSAPHVGAGIPAAATIPRYPGRGILAGGSQAHSGEVAVPHWRWKQRFDGPDPDTCEHDWRLRDVTMALPGPYVCEVCDRCGMLHLDGPDAVTGPMTNVADGAALHLESEQRRSQVRDFPRRPPH
jgi:hypothetical protein